MLMDQKGWMVKVDEREGLINWVGRMDRMDE